MFNKLNMKTAITGLKNDELIEKEKKMLEGGGETSKTKTRVFNINNDEDSESIKNALSKYVRIEDRHVDIIPPCCYVRYLCKETGDLKYGGKVIKHYEKDGEKYFLITRYHKFFSSIRKRNRIFFVRDDEEEKMENEEKITIYHLYKSGKLKLINDDEDPQMEPSDYFDEYFIIND